MLVFMLAAIAAATQEPPSGATAPNDAVEDVVVIAKRQRQSPVDIFHTHCFDGNRLDGQAFRPVDAPGWTAREARAGDQVGGPTQAFSRRDGPVELILHIREGVADTLPNVSRNRCSVTVIGDHDASAVEREMSAVMGGRGTTEGLDALSPINPLFGGWQRHAWFSIPDRSSRDWRTLMSERPPRPVAVQVVRPSYYRDKKYVVTELRSGEMDDMPVSQMILHVFYRTPG